MESLTSEVSSLDRTLGAIDQDLRDHVAEASNAISVLQSENYRFAEDIVCIESLISPINPHREQKHRSDDMQRLLERLDDIQQSLQTLRTDVKMFRNDFGGMSFGSSRFSVRLIRFSAKSKKQITAENPPTTDLSPQNLTFRQSPWPCQATLDAFSAAVVRDISDQFGRRCDAIFEKVQALDPIMVRLSATLNLLPLNEFLSI